MPAFFVEVITTQRDNPEIITHEPRIINYDNSRSRKWLAEHSNWALRNGLAVHTAAAKTKRWKPVTDNRTRHVGKHVEDVWPQINFPDDEMPPVDLGRFNCRGEYIFRNYELSRSGIAPLIDPANALPDFDDPEAPGKP